MPKVLNNIFGVISLILGFSSIVGIFGIAIYSPSQTFEATAF